jgi:hypothetical protein
MRLIILMSFSFELQVLIKIVYERFNQQQFLYIALIKINCVQNHIKN